MKRIFFVLICLVVLVSCNKEKNYTVEISFDEFNLKYTVENSFCIDNITPKENYEYIGLYLDDYYQTEFNGFVDKDLKLYLKYKKFSNVVVKTEETDLVFKVYENEPFDINELKALGYDRFKLYTDVEKTEEYMFNVINKNMTLYLEKYLIINIYKDSESVERIYIKNNDSLNESDLLNRYGEYEFYADSNLLEEFDFSKVITEDVNIYLKPKYYNVTIKTSGEDINLKVDENNLININDIIKLGYKNFKLYIDESEKNEFDYKKITNDITLYLKEYLLVSIYDNELLREKVFVNKDGYLDETLYNSRYNGCKLFIDKELKNEFDYNDIISSDICLYLDNKKETVTVEVITKNVIQLFTLNKGDYLTYDNLQYKNSIDMDYISTGFLYYDKELTYIYDYGPVENDLVLYEECIFINPDDLVEVQIVSYDGKEDGNVYITMARGESVDLKEIPITSGRDFDGLYYDELFTKKYNNESIFNNTLLYLKTKPFNENDKLWRLRFYRDYTTFKTGIPNSLYDEMDIYLETQVKDGTVIGHDSCRKIFFEGGLLGIYNMNTHTIYKGEPIIANTDFYIICIETFEPDNFEWKKTSYSLNDDYTVLYNDERNKTLIYDPTSDLNIISIVDGNKKYQIYMSNNVILTKEDVIGIIGKENIEFNDILIDSDYIIYV